MSTVLIATPKYLQVLKARKEFADAQTFADTEAPSALEIITRTRPEVVVLERLFAATARGEALSKRITADPHLSSCEIRIVAHGSENGRPSVPDPAGATDDLAPAGAWGPEAPWQEMPLDRGGTRRALRFRLVDGVEVMLDQHSAILIDLSIVGAQVLSPTILKPNQRVRVAFGESRQDIRCNTNVVWAWFERVGMEPLYRAGLEFVGADPEALENFYPSTKKSRPYSR